MQVFVRKLDRPPLQGIGLFHSTHFDLCRSRRSAGGAALRTAVFHRSAPLAHYTMEVRKLNGMQP